jgi:hypothetical protein
MQTTRRTVAEQPSAEAIEVEARCLLREQIERSAWFPGMKKEERRAMIELEVDAWWHLKLKEAAAPLNRMAGSGIRAGCDPVVREGEQEAK